MTERAGLRAAFIARRSRIRSRPALDFGYRVGVAVVGAAIIAGGIVLLPLPGPGWVIIFLGLGVLASEYAWAGRLLAYAKAHVSRWARWAGRQPLYARFGLGVASLAIVVAAVYGYDRWRGLPGWIPGVG